VNKQPIYPKRITGKRFGSALLVLLIIIISGGASMYAAYRYQIRPINGRSTTSVSFEIPHGQGVPKIASRLREAGLIRDKNIFLLYVNIHGLRSGLEAGTYSLSSDKSIPEIADILSKGKVMSNLLVIPEGSTLTQIEALATKHGISNADFKAALRDKYTSKYASLRPTKIDLEGYLFPDGYQVSRSTSAHQLVQNMLTTLDRRLTPELVKALATQGLDVHQGLTLASMIEKEVANASDRPIVAQVFLSRLAAGQALQSDVTVLYASALEDVPFDLKLDSPYNTYVHKGLPIGPICSPGLDAINAAAHPAKTDYLYFVSGKDGRTHFSKTLPEHLAKVAKYL
jgi:UPF0755 protein